MDVELSREDCVATLRKREGAFSGLSPLSIEQRMHQVRVDVAAVQVAAVPSVRQASGRATVSKLTSPLDVCRVCRHRFSLD